MTNCDSGERRLVAVPEGGLWDCAAVAQYLGVSKSWVWKQCRENLGLPFVRLGTATYRFDPAKVQAWLEKQGQQQTPPPVQVG